MNSELIRIENISIIIPVKNNQRGIDNFLNSFFKTQQSDKMPGEIIIVDNNSQPPIRVSKQHLNYCGVSIRLITNSKKGPAAARNSGAKIAIGDWLLFTDSDCIPTSSSLIGFEITTSQAIAYAGKVIPHNRNYISNFYSYINLLNPGPHLQDENQPAYLVTANCLIRKEIFVKTGGFDENFDLAGGEDVELSIRLFSYGKLNYATNAVTAHEYENTLIGFYQRFWRYGKGMKRVIEKHKLPLTIAKMLPEVKEVKFFPLKLLMLLAFKKGLKS